MERSSKETWIPIGIIAERIVDLARRRRIRPTSDKVGDEIERDSAEVDEKEIVPGGKRGLLGGAFFPAGLATARAFGARAKHSSGVVKIERGAKRHLLDI